MRSGEGAVPVRLRLSRAKGFDLQALSRATNGLEAVVVARPSAAGNPWTIRGAREAGYTGTDRQLAAMCSRMFREWVEEHPGSLTRMLKDGDRLLSRFRAFLPKIVGCNVACWCPLPEPGEDDVCHGCVCIEIANGPPSVRPCDRPGREGGEP